MYHQRKVFAIAQAKDLGAFRESAHEKLKDRKILAKSC
jgi:hypothetical protein